MLRVMKEMSMASIVATAGRNNLFSVLGLGACLYELLCLSETVFVVKIIVLFGGLWLFIGTGAAWM